MGNKGRLTVYDMPGYGEGSHEEWGKEIMKYLVGRKEYVFLLCMSKCSGGELGEIVADDGVGCEELSCS